MEHISVWSLLMASIYCVQRRETECSLETRKEVSLELKLCIHVSSV
jgi:hypothetical protein